MRSNFGCIRDVRSLKSEAYLLYVSILSDRTTKKTTKRTSKMYKLFRDSSLRLEVDFIRSQKIQGFRDVHNILVIDDEKPIWRLLQEALTRSGYQVRTASGGREGLRLFDDELFDLVITDIVMPDIDGHTVARHIRDSDRPHTPIMGISGTPWLLKGDEFDHVLPKPFSLKTLEKAVEDMVSPASARQTASKR